MVQAVEHLYSKHEVLSSNPRTANKTKQNKQTRNPQLLMGSINSTVFSGGIKAL
jgi:hypothetical protein